MTNKEIINLTERHVTGTYRRFPVAIVKGDGVRVWDADGKGYLDFTAGLAVCNLGHCHPAVVGAIKEQAEKLIHCSNLYHIEPQAEFAALLTENSFADRVFFCNSGAEANEAAIKLARKYFFDRREPRFKVITMEKSFHGRTFAALAATGQEKVREGFEPLLEKFIYVPFNDLGAVKDAVDEATAAVMVEPIQGEGGVNLPDENYLRWLKEVCEEAGVLLIFDEVQVGVGRTGKLFAYENYGVTPDIMTLAKGLAGGVAIGAMLATEDVGSAFTPGSHASTFGGNPLATAAGLAAVKTTIEDGVLENCSKVGGYLLKSLTALKEKYGFITEVRGKGLIIGVEVKASAPGIVKECLEKGLLINAIGENVLRFIPPLIVTEKEVDEMIGILEGVMEGI
ncbi:MAG: acetylornithine transaminase [Thermodesulfobacteriota bacterium]|nr:MAG: acetylornithine transaminase [Thermodesulfobacteriota bacterium]